MVKRWATIGLLVGLVGQPVSNGANSSFWQLSTQKAKTQWATTTASSGLAIGHVFDSPSKATDVSYISFILLMIVKGTFGDHRVTGALNLHKIRDWY